IPCMGTRSPRTPATRRAGSKTSWPRSRASSTPTATQARSPAACTSSSPVTTSPRSWAGPRRSMTKVCGVVTRPSSTRDSTTTSRSKWPSRSRSTSRAGSDADEPSGSASVRAASLGHIRRPAAPQMNAVPPASLIRHGRVVLSRQPPSNNTRPPSSNTRRLRTVRGLRSVLLVVLLVLVAVLLVIVGLVVLLLVLLVVLGVFLLLLALGHADDDERIRRLRLGRLWVL